MGDAAKRNQPCFCGSGKKYKNCHLGKAPPEQVRKQMFIPVLLCLAGIAAGGSIIVYKNQIVAGIAFILAGFVFAMLVALFRDPPPPDASGKDPGAINFGG